jgi:hypothetical protein
MSIPTMRQGIDIIKKVEALYPEWTPANIVDALRAVAGYEDDRWRAMLKATAPIIVPGKRLTSAEYEFLKLCLSHTLNKQTWEEQGVCMDLSTKRPITLGHTICGISAGIHSSLTGRVEVRNIPEVGTFSLDPGVVNVMMGVTNLKGLYAVTIAGDLGQTVTPDAELCRNANCGYAGGVGTDATAAELLGDIDGFILGYWLSTKKQGHEVRRALIQGNKYKGVGKKIKLSDMLEEYYLLTPKTQARPIDMKTVSGSSLQANLRFSTFNGMYPGIKSTLLSQTIAFNYWFATAKNIAPSQQDAIQAVQDFEYWFKCNYNAKSTVDACYDYPEIHSFFFSDPNDSRTISFTIAEDKDENLSPLEYQDIAAEVGITNIA